MYPLDYSDIFACHPLQLRPQEHLEFLQEARTMARSSTCNHGYREGCIVLSKIGKFVSSGAMEMRLGSSMFSESNCDRYCFTSNLCLGHHAGMMAAINNPNVSDGTAYLVRMDDSDNDLPICIICLIPLESVGVQWIVVPSDSLSEYSILNIHEAERVAV